MCIIGCSQVPKYVLEGLPKLSCWVSHAPADDPYDMCKSDQVVTIVYMMLGNRSLRMRREKNRMIKGPVVTLLGQLEGTHT